MFNFDPTFIFLLMLLHCLIGLTAAIVADTKGNSFLLWLIIGMIGGTFGLIASIKSTTKVIQE
ncbi:hypothetical protein ACN4EE_03675 [Geminocystis sp. CENA526]|uniref:hypothetical protein n=1 Tax=Geminocystis sp. CENA526 TaxID=1355871 RepID=UPI003D6F4A93